MPDTRQELTGLGNYFVANYPPFSTWKSSHLEAAEAVLCRPPRAHTPLGLYLHIPFCRKRCKFCYFRVYTDKNASEVTTYLDALLKEVALYAAQPVVGGRPLHFVYFGGGTPSYLSATQLRGLIERLQTLWPWDQTEEVTFECEPGTLQKHKLETLRDLGVTRLSLGVENFADEVLQANGRAHLSAEIHRAADWIRELAFPQVNIDLIAGMVGETDANWQRCIEKTIALAPDSVTIYQMELPFNTVFSKELKVIGQDEPPGQAVADWPTKRRWVAEAFTALETAGYEPSSGYTMVKRGGHTRFVYRDSLWHGADMFGTGVASFGHVNTVHVQNVDTWEQYLAALQGGRLPLGRALPTTVDQRLTREMILQLKTGRLEANYFHAKFGIDILDRFADSWQHLEADGFLQRTPAGVALTRSGLLQVDRLLPLFFEPAYRNTRYT